MLHIYKINAEFVPEESLVHLHAGGVPVMAEPTEAYGEVDGGGGDGGGGDGSGGFRGEQYS